MIPPPGSCLESLQLDIGEDETDAAPLRPAYREKRLHLRAQKRDRFGNIIEKSEGAKVRDHFQEYFACDDPVQCATGSEILAGTGLELFGRNRNWIASIKSWPDFTGFLLDFSEL